jgi:RimJ/RimL family protein N-acetyltransferase
VHAKQQTLPAALPSEAASRVVALVSPHDGHVAIGPALPDDLGALFLWLNDAAAARTDMPYRPLDCAAFKQWMDGQTLSGHVLFVIRTLVSSRAVGFVDFKNFNMVFRSAELGVRIGTEMDRGMGYGSRAVALALGHAWNNLNLHRVSLMVFADNDRAISAYRRAGFREEGVLRHAAYVEGHWRDMLVMSALNPREA